MYEILRHLKNEIEHRKEQIMSGLPGPSSELVAQYHYRIGYLHALIQTQDQVKEIEAKKMQQDLE